MRKTRNQLLAGLEEYWENFVKENPEEQADIPGAMEYYRTLTDSRLRDEYEDKIGECVELYYE